MPVNTLLCLLFSLASEMPGPEGYPVDPADDFAPMLAFMALIALAVVLALAGIVFLFAIGILAVLGLFTLLGIVSTSVLAGLVRGKVSAALRTFLYLSLCVLAVPSGMGLCWLLASFDEGKTGSGHVLLVGAFAGLLAGLFLAWLLDLVATAVFRPRPAPPASTELTGSSG